MFRNFPPGNQFPRPNNNINDNGDHGHYRPTYYPPTSTIDRHEPPLHGDKRCMIWYGSTTRMFYLFLFNNTMEFLL